MKMKTVSDVRREFDAIARAGAERPDPPGLYDDFLLSLIPKPCERALEIGCGTGRFTRALAARVRHVTAVDLSPEMIRVARGRVPMDNVTFVEGDALDQTSRLGSFDCVVTLATFHHLPQDAAADCVKAALAPGGTLILHDLWRVDAAADRVLDGVRIPVKAIRLLRLGAPLTHTRAERAAWREHERDDLHLTPREVDALKRRHFPHATVHKHFLWRYTLLWHSVA
jgi:SAM-dependent methyltransferase